MIKLESLQHAHDYWRFFLTQYTQIPEDKPNFVVILATLLQCSTLCYTRLKLQVISIISSRSLYNFRSMDSTHLSNFKFPKSIASSFPDQPRYKASRQIISSLSDCLLDKCFIRIAPSSQFISFFQFSHGTLQLLAH